MLDPVAIQLASRAMLLTFGNDADAQRRPVAKTGVMALAAVADGYTRAAGSFIADGFARGMEVTPAGFGSNARRQIIGVTATKIQVTGAVPLEGSAGGRSLTVGLPASISWEDTEFRPVPGVPYVEEQFVPGPRFPVGVGERADFELRPTAVYFIHVPSNSRLAARLYADALLRLFAVGADIPFTQTTPADWIKVRWYGETPTAGQLIDSSEPGFKTVPVTIPIIARTLNFI